MKNSSEKKQHKVLRELLKDSSRSDREIAKKIGLSQPTISRIKKQLIKDGSIRTFSAIPNFSKLGFKIMALTFVKIKPDMTNERPYRPGHEKVQKWLQNKPNVIFSDYCRGMDMNAVLISLHYSYHEFEKFLSNNQNEMGNLVTEVKNVLIDLSSKEGLKSFDFPA